MLAYGVATFFPRLYAFLAIFLFSRLLSVHDFGLYVLAIAVGEFCDFTSLAWFRVGFLRLYHLGGGAADADRLDLPTVYAFTLKCTSVAIMLCWITAFLLVRGEPLTFAIATTLYVVANGTVQASLNTLRGEGRAKTYAAIESLRPLTNLSLGFAAVKLIHANFAVAAYTVFGSNALVGVVALSLLWFRRRHLPGKDSVPEIVRDSWPLLLSCFLIAVMNATDRYQLQWWLGTQAVALYAAAYAIGRQPIDLLFNALNLGAFTELMKCYDLHGPEAASRLLGRQITLIFGIAFPAVVGISLLGADILHVLFDRRYWQETPQLIPIIGLMALFAGLRSYGYDQGFYMVRKTGVQVFAVLPSVIAGTVVSAILIKFMGIPGAAYGSCIGYGASLLLGRMLVRRYLPGHLPWRDIAKILLATGAMAAAVELSRSDGVMNGIVLVRHFLAGATVYGAVVVALDVLGVRERLTAIIGRWRERGEVLSFVSFRRK
jgi:O-antigen/teichoic acid export membrane protein